MGFGNGLSGIGGGKWMETHPKSTLSLSLSLSSFSTDIFIQIENFFLPLIFILLPGCKRCLLRFYIQTLVYSSLMSHVSKNLFLLLHLFSFILLNYYIYVSVDLGGVFFQYFNNPIFFREDFLR